MCGITAIYSYRNGSSLVDLRELAKISDQMAARGPDGEGSWISADKKIGFAHKRLAIIDTTEGGSQPMFLTNGNGEVRLVITYNGEIYNFKELRQELISDGIRFTTQSDTEVLLHLYDRFGSAMVARLRGMFAFAIWDNEKHRLFLARDPFGIKPLYYSDVGGVFRVASQVKALLAGNKIPTNPEPAGHVGFFSYGYIPEPYTLYKNILALPSGHTLTVGSNGASKIIKYYDPLDTLEKVSSNSKNVDQFITIKNSLLDSIKSHLVSDVPVGVFLSAGLDSATLTGFASQLSQDPLNTVTLQFEELVGTPADEAPLAEEISSLYNTNHVTSTVVGGEFYSELRSMLNAMDQPSIDGANTYFVAREASKLGLKVALSGLGGDEVFGGYSSFRQIPLLVNLLRWVPYGEFVGHLLRRSASPFLTKLISPKYLSLLEYGGNYSGAYLLRRGLFMPWELPAVIDSDMALEGWEKLNFIESTNKRLSKINHSKARVSALELMWYMRNQLLRDSDWAGMAHSLEIRTPLVDSVFFSELGALSATKLDMAQSLDVPLPKSVLNRPKTGFYLPIREWLTANGLQNYGEGYKGWAKMVYEHFISRL